MKRGPKGKTASLHILEGTFNSTRHTQGGMFEPESSQVLRVRELEGEELRLFNEYSKILWWLTDAESMLFDNWIAQTADLLKFKSGQAAQLDWRTSAMHTSYRLLSAELGIGVSGMGKRPSKGKKKKDPESKYFR